MVVVEQDTGVEPAFTAWEAVVLPIYESCMVVIIADWEGKFNCFLSVRNIPFPGMRKETGELLFLTNFRYQSSGVEDGTLKNRHFSGVERGLFYGILFLQKQTGKLCNITKI